jgi:hypothetical protein
MVHDKATFWFAKNDMVKPMTFSLSEKINVHFVTFPL